MKINDKVIAAFLVSMGLFTSVQAKTYVSNLSDGDRQTLLAAATDSGECGGVDSIREPVENK